MQESVFFLMDGAFGGQCRVWMLHDALADQDWKSEKTQAGPGGSNRTPKGIPGSQDGSHAISF